MACAVSIAIADIISVEPNHGMLPTTPSLPTSSTDSSIVVMDCAYLQYPLCYSRSHQTDFYTFYLYVIIVIRSSGKNIIGTKEKTH